MYRRSGVILFCIAFSLFLMGCQSSTTTKEVLYENEEVGIVIYESSGWTLENESKSGVWNATFRNDSMKANITLLPGIRQMKEIKDEVFLEDYMTILEESENYLSLKTNKEGIQTDIYTEQLEDQTALIGFVVGKDISEIQENMLLDFKNNIEFIK